MTDKQYGGRLLTVHSMVGDTPRQGGFAASLAAFAAQGRIAAGRGIALRVRA
jgi:hypothetical protein